MASEVYVVFILLAITSGASDRPPHTNEDEVEDLKDLLHTSMQSIVSLDDLVTTLTQKVADLTVSFAETKADLEQRETTVDQEIAETKDDMRQIKTSVEEEIANLKITGGDGTREVMVVSGEEEPGEARCARVCAGTTGRGTTTWNDVTSNGVKLSVDISKCGFVKVPTVTTSVEGNSAQWKATGLAAVYSTTTTSFAMWVEGLQYSPTNGNAESWGWNVEWVAVGYTC